VTVDHSQQHATPADVEAITATILTAVERQLTRYFAAMSQQADAARKISEDSRDELRSELASRLPSLQEEIEHQREALDQQRAANDAYQTALQTALEDRLSEFANHEHWRMNDLEDKIANLRGIDPETMIEIRQTVRDDMEKAFNGVNTRLDEFVTVHKRYDEQSIALVAHINDTISGLTMRMDDGDQRVARAVEERLTGFETELGTSIEELVGQVNEHANTLLAKLDSSEDRATDRLLELEARMKEEQGTKIANVEAALGRIGSGFDDAMIAVNQRVLDLENKLYEFEDRIGEIAERLAKVDEDAFDEVRAAMSSAVGEATLVRIELDRVAADTNEKMDKHLIRMSEIEGMLADTMDVSTAVQLERLDELERQMQLIDASMIVAAGSTGGSANAAHTGDTSTSAYGSDSTPAGGGNRPAPPSMSLNPRLPAADTTAQDDGTLETEPTFSTH
jgi:molybdopterin converting factor small subunit